MKQRNRSMRRDDLDDDPLVEVIPAVRAFWPEVTIYQIKMLRETGQLPQVQIGRMHFCRRSAVAAFRQRIVSALASA